MGSSNSGKSRSDPSGFSGLFPVGLIAYNPKFLNPQDSLVEASSKLSFNTTVTSSSV